MKVISIAACLVLVSGAAGAQLTTETETQKLLPPDYHVNDGIGSAVAARGDWLFVGNFNDGVTVGQQGSVRVYRWLGDAWVDSDLLVASDPGFFAQFGTSVAASDDTLIVGAPGYDAPGAANQGTVYAFHRQDDAWVEAQHLFPAGFDVWGGYGPHVVLDGHRAFVLGRYNDPLGDPQQWALFIFLRTPGGWVQEDPFLFEGIPNPAINNWAVENDRLVIGEPLYDGPAFEEQGRVQVFKRNDGSWTLEATLTASDPSIHAHFGSAVDLEGDRIAVGAPSQGSTTAFDLRGAAYVFRHDGDTWVEELATGEFAEPLGHLGSSVELEGSLLFAGAPSYHTAADLAPGAVFAFHRSGTTWTPVDRFLATEGDDPDDLGVRCAANGPVVVGSCPSDWSPPSLFGAHGSAYAFDSLPQGWTHRGGSSPGAAGHPILTADGELDGNDKVTLELQRAAPSSPVFLVIGLSALDAPFHDGVLVPEAGVVIGGLLTNAEGALILSGRWPTLPFGTTVYLQEWIADASAATGFAGSNGVAALVP